MNKHLAFYLRLISKNKFFFFINLINSSLGLVICFFLADYLVTELSFDKFHTQTDRIYRVVSDFKSDKNSTYEGVKIQAPMGPLLKEQFQEIEDVVRLRTLNVKPTVSVKDMSYAESQLYFADKEIFNIFSVSLIQGKLNEALHGNHKAVLSKHAVKKYFGNEDPVGKEFYILDSIPFIVSGVFDDFTHSHFNPEILLPYTALKTIVGDNFNTWDEGNSYTYLLLRKDASQAVVQAKLAGFIKLNASKEYISNKFSYHLQPLSRIHLYSHREDEFEPNGNIKHIYIFSSVGFVVLTIICFNSILLYFGLAFKRSKENGIRKFLGSSKFLFVGRSIQETIFNNLLALGLAIAFIKLVFDHNLHFSGGLILILGLIFMLLSLIPGIWTGVIMRGKNFGSLVNRRVSGHKNFKYLITFQIVIATALLIMNFVIRQQMKFVNTTPLGINTENILYVELMDDPEVLQNVDVFKNKLLALSGIESVTSSSGVPGRDLYTNPVQFTGDTEMSSINSLSGDPDFIKTYNLNLIAGKDFTTKELNSKEHSFIVNRSFVRDLISSNPEEALQKELNWKGTQTGKIVGVVEDFHFENLKQKINPVILVIHPRWYNYLSVRYTGTAHDTQVNVEKTWKEMYKKPLLYHFLNQDAAFQYAQDTQFWNLINLSSFAATIIACVGLIGMSVFSLQQRIKEFAIRKVAGASTSTIVLLVSKHYSAMAIIGVLIALPLGLKASEYWIQEFEYRANYGIPIVLTPLFIIMITVWLSILFQTVKTASRNPVDNLRNN